MDLLKLAQGKLDNPIMRQWALQRYEDARTRSDGSDQEMEKIWFDDLTLRKWINSDDKRTLASVFRILSPSAFVNLNTTVAEQWKTWSGPLAWASTPILLNLDALERATLFVEHMKHNLSDLEKTVSVVNHLTSLPEEMAIDLFKKIEEVSREIEKNAFAKNWLQHALITPAIHLAPDMLPPLVHELVNSQDNREDASENLFKYLSEALFGSAVYFKNAQFRNNGDEGVEFQSLGFLFQDGAPLSDLDAAMKASPKFAETLALLEAHSDKSDKIILAQKIIESANHTGRIDEIDLTCFAVAAVANAYELSEIDISGMSLEKVLNTIALDLSEVPEKDELVVRLLAFDPGEVADAINKKLPKVKNEWGGIHLAEIAGEMRLERTTPTLIDSLCEQCGDYLCEAASDSLVKIGEASHDAIVDGWDDLDSSQKIYGSGVLGRIGNVKLVDFVHQRFEDMFNQDLEQWCILAETVPDVRTVNLLEPELRRNQILIDETFYRLCFLTGKDHEKLDDIHSRILEHEIEIEARLDAFDSGSFQNDTINLPLRCVECGDVNKYNVKDVVVSPELKEYPHLLADEFPCASCGEWSDFEFTGEANMAITASLVLVLGQQESGKEASLPVRHTDVTAQNEQLPAPKLLARLKIEAEDNPGGVVENLRLGRALFLFSRPQAAKKCYDRVTAKEPNSMEAGLGLARISADTGNKEEAYNMVCSLLKNKDDWKFFRLAEIPTSLLNSEFSKLHNDLVNSLGVQNRPLLHERFMGSAKKIGRNAPCPCGSGKKFKKCCLN